MPGFSCRLFSNPNFLFLLVISKEEFMQMKAAPFLFPLPTEIGKTDNALSKLGSVSDATCKTVLQFNVSKSVTFSQYCQPWQDCFRSAARYPHPKKGECHGQSFFSTDIHWQRAAKPHGKSKPFGKLASAHCSGTVLHSRQCRANITISCKK